MISVVNVWLLIILVFRIDLYVGNLQAFGSMAAFTAGCAYTSESLYVHYVNGVFVIVVLKTPPNCFSII